LESISSKNGATPPRREGTPTPGKLWGFRVLLIAPWLPLLLPLVAFSVRLAEVREGAGEGQFETLVSYLQAKHLSWEVEGLTRGPAARRIYFLGASSLVLPNPTLTFPAIVQTLLDHPTSRIVCHNLARSGIDSYSIKSILSRALELHKPDLVVLYAGHNDYNIPYRTLLKPRYHLIRGTRAEQLLETLGADSWFFSRLKVGFGSGLGWFLESNLEPLLLKYLQRSGLLRIDDALFARCDAAILAAYVANLEAILGLTREAHLPLVVVVPVCNLETEPVGTPEHTTQPYFQGLAETDQAARLSLLRRARDGDRFGGDLRAKTPLLEHLRGLASTEGVVVFDLERALEKRGARFDYGEFYDAFHLLPQTHRLVAELLAPVLRELLASPRRATPPVPLP